MSSLDWQGATRNAAARREARRFGEGAATRRPERRATRKQLAAIERMRGELGVDAPESDRELSREGASSLIQALARRGATLPASTKPLSRLDALEARCKKCGAGPGEPCFGSSERDGQRRERKAPHAQRYAARAEQEPAEPP